MYTLWVSAHFFRSLAIYLKHGRPETTDTCRQPGADSYTGYQRPAGGAQCAADTACAAHI